MFIILKNGYFQLWILYNSDLRNSTAEENIYELSKLTMLSLENRQYRSGYNTSIYIWSTYIWSILHLVNLTFGQLLHLGILHFAN